MAPRKRTLLSEEIKKGTTYLKVGLGLILVIAGILSLQNLTTSGQNGYRFRQQEILNEQLTDENHRLQIEILEASSFSSINQMDKISKMIPAETVEFFKSRLERLSKK